MSLSFLKVVVKTLSLSTKPEGMIFLADFKFLNFFGLKETESRQLFVTRLIVA